MREGANGSCTTALLAFGRRGGLDRTLCILFAGDELGETTFDPRAKLVDTGFAGLFASAKQVGGLGRRLASQAFLQILQTVEMRA